MKLKDGFILRDIAGEPVVIPAGEDLTLNRMITLNSTGCTLWKALDKGAELPELVEALTSQYDVDRDTARAHAEAFVAKLREYGFLAD